MSEEHASHERSRASLYLAAPSTKLGRLALYLFTATLAAVMIMASVVEPASPPWRDLFASLVAIFVFMSALTGGAAVVLAGERSSAVVLPAFICVIIAVNELIQLWRAL